MTLRPVTSAVTSRNNRNISGDIGQISHPPSIQLFYPPSERVFSLPSVPNQCLFQFFQLSADFRFQFGLGREMELVAAGENFFLPFGAERVLHDRVVLFRAKD